MAFTFTLTLMYGLFYRTVDGLVQTIRDEEFRIGRTLHNFEDIQGEVEILEEVD